MSPNSSIAPPIAGDSPALHHLSHVEAWIFDLDNTLYPASCNLFVQVEALIGRFIEDFLQVDAVEARRLQKQYYRAHGTTLKGLMAHHGCEPEIGRASCRERECQYG